MYLKTDAEIEYLAECNRLVAQVMAGVAEQIVPCAIPLEIDAWAENEIRKRKGKPAFKGYRGFPSTICFSVNERVVHGIPDRSPVKVGDIVSVDLGILLNGYYGDMARTFPVGQVAAECTQLIRVAEESLACGIEQFQEGNRLHDISAAVQQRVEAEGFSVVRDYVGHGIGRALHEDPQVPNFGRKGTGPRLRKGLVLAIEPMVNAGSHAVELLDDMWTVVTLDRKPSAHVENTVALTAEGPRILTCV